MSFKEVGTFSSKQLFWQGLGSFEVQFYIEELQSLGVQSREITGELDFPFYYESGCSLVRDPNEKKNVLECFL